MFADKYILIIISILLALILLPLSAQQDTDNTQTAVNTPSSDSPPVTNTDPPETPTPTETPATPETETTTSQNAQPPSEPSTEPGTDPNQPPQPEPAFPLHPEPDEPPLPAWNPPEKYFQRAYHPQVTPRVFMILAYHYFFKGTDYPLSDISNFVPDESYLSSENLTDESSADPNSPVTKNPSPQNLHETRFNLEKCYDLIHKWRNLNEAIGTAREIIYSINLTKTSTNIHRINPKLAIQVRRDLGRIAKINRNFDIVSRMTICDILAGKPHKSILLHMGKMLADLTSLLDHLAQQNDQISIALGLGKIDRTAPKQQPIDFSDLNLVSDDQLNP